LPTEDAGKRVRAVSESFGIAGQEETLP